MASRRKKKKTSLRNRLINIFATLLILLSIALIFNAPIRNMIMVWHTNQYQVNKVSKKTIDKNKDAKTSFDFKEVKSLSTESVINAQWQAQKFFRWLPSAECGFRRRGSALGRFRAATGGSRRSVFRRSRCRTARCRAGR